MLLAFCFINRNYCLLCSQLLDLNMRARQINMLHKKVSKGVFLQLIEWATIFLHRQTTLIEHCLLSWAQWFKALLA